jgi:hypothetical protein
MNLQAIPRHTFFTMKVFARSTIHCKIDAKGRRLIDRIPPVVGWMLTPDLILSREKL